MNKEQEVSEDLPRQFHKEKQDHRLMITKTQDMGRELTEEREVLEQEREEMKREQEFSKDLRR